MIIMKIRVEDARIAARQSHEFGPRIAEIGWSEGLGLNQMVLILCVSSFLGSFSLVMKASIWMLRSDDNSRPDVGRIRSSMEMSEEFLNEQIKVILGIPHALVWVMAIKSRIIDMNGVIPLPPLTITKDSYLEEDKIYLIKVTCATRKCNPNPLEF